MKPFSKHKHHIVPRHAGGTDDPSNLVEVTIEEHAELHLDLYLTHGRWEDWVAYHMVSGQIGKEEMMALIAKGRGQKLRGRKHTPEAIEKMRQAKRGTVFTEAHKKKLSKAAVKRGATNKGMTLFDAEGREKMSLLKGGRERTVVSPSGEKFSFINQSGFARDHGLCPKAFNAMLRGVTKSHKGWKEDK